MCLKFANFLTLKFISHYTQKSFDFISIYFMQNVLKNKFWVSWISFYFLIINFSRDFLFLLLSSNNLFLCVTQFIRVDKDKISNIFSNICGICRFFFIYLFIVFCGIVIIAHILYFSVCIIWNCEYFPNFEKRGRRKMGNIYWYISSRKNYKNAVWFDYRSSLGNFVYINKYYLPLRNIKRNKKKKYSLLF